MKKQLNLDAISNELRGSSLFFSRPPAQAKRSEQPASKSEPAPQAADTQTSRRLGTTTPRPPDAQAPRHPGPQIPRPRDPQLDLTKRAESRQTLRLTEGEFRKLGLVQGTLSELLGVTKVDKNDIIRAAMHRSLEEFDQVGIQSDLVTRLRKKYR